MAGIVAVLTGDLVESSKLSIEELDSARAAVMTAVEDLRQYRPGAVTGRAAFYRGDAWQAAVTAPGFCLRLALLVRAGLKAKRIDTRMGIGIGGYDRIVDEDVSLSTGGAFAASGKALEGLKKRSRMGIILAEGSEEAGVWPRAVVALCDQIVGDWKPRQAEVVRWLLVGATQVEAAQRVNPTMAQPTATKALAGSGWVALEEALKAFEGNGGLWKV